MIAVIASATLAQFVQAERHSQFLIVESETASDKQADTLEFDSLQFVLLFHETSPLATPGCFYAYRVDDETAEAQSAFNAAHLQRGPPLC